MRSRLEVSALVLALVGLAGVAVSCGGGGSATSGPSGGGGSASGAVVQGQIRTRTAAGGPSTFLAALETVLGVRTAEAAPLAGVTIQLVDPANPADVRYSTVTDASGAFQFTAVAPGSYLVLVPGFTVSPAVVVEVGVGDTGILIGTIDGDTAQVTASITVTDPGDLVQNHAQLCHAINISSATGVPLQQIIDERLSGQGWGRIARNHGAHPGVLGLRGNCSTGELATASALADGKAKGKGKGKKNGPA